MPGFTHLQTAQPVTFGHHLMAYVEMFDRDRGRFADAIVRMNESPLGAAALAGTGFPIDRHMTAKALGFDRPMANSLDCVSARDFALEALSRRRHLRAASLAPRRRDRDLVLRPVRLRAHVGCVVHRLQHHAAEAQPRRRRTRARQVRPRHRLARPALHHHEGPAARLFEGHAGRQADHVRSLRRARPLPASHDRHDRHHDAEQGAHARLAPRPASRPRPTSPTGSSANSTSPSAKPTTSPAPP